MAMVVAKIVRVIEKCLIRVLLAGVLA
jgi:hypothetical protein